MSVVLQEAK